MIDLHCHLLPGIDDGAETLEMALQMARIAAADGIETIVCTPHIYPGMYDNNASGIRLAVGQLQSRLDEAGIALRLLAGADAHLVPDMAGEIQSDRVPTLAGSRYLLLEPPHHVAPPRFEETIFELMTAGVVPVITHPERLSWVESHYDIFERLVARGCWMQITAGALTGRFGPRVRYWGERFVGDGNAHVLATDAHHPKRRPPLLAEAREAAALLIGAEHAEHMVQTRPAAVIANRAPDTLPALAGNATGAPGSDIAGSSWLPNWLRRSRGRA
jgi:protein-tyrosine phosphatase